LAGLDPLNLPENLDSSPPMFFGPGKYAV